MNDVTDLWDRLHRSRFRSRFHLQAKDKQYVMEKGMAQIEAHAYEFVHKRIASGNLINDGKQTPMRGHPVFLAQHATATCCRGCIEKWHHISKGKNLTKEEETYLVNIIMAWIRKELEER